MSTPRHANRFFWAILILTLGTSDRARAEDVPAGKSHAEIARRLGEFIKQEMAHKGIPAMSIALVDDQQIVWSHGFGFVDREKKTPATSDTVYRVGSVSKLFTDLAVMKLVERGVLDLDAPVSKYLADFRPKNPFEKPITLRQLMTHRAGLVRESPVGNYFDPSEPSLKDTVLSLNTTELVYPPEKRIKYSNSGIATVGRVLEVSQKQSFAKYLSANLLQPLGMKNSSFEPDPALMKRLAQATMWTYHGTEFPAPTFELGMAPAGCMYSTVNDLGLFLQMLFDRGRTPGGAIVKEETLNEMWRAQFSDKPNEGFGLGFALGRFGERRFVGHGGAIYGFSTELAALPDDKLGVVVTSSRDCTNTVGDRVAEYALSLLIAQKEGKPLPTVETTKPLDSKTVEKLAGSHVKTKQGVLDFEERGGRLFLIPRNGGYITEIRSRGDHLIVDDRLAYGMVIEEDPDGGIRINDERYDLHRDTTPPDPAPEKWLGLIGEYGWDHNVLYILEKGGKLHALIEWFFLYPLEEVSENVYMFPDFGLYHGEKIIFTRDKTGRATQADVATIVFQRRNLRGENSTFQITPARPIEEIRKTALSSEPPVEKGTFRKPDLVDLAAFHPAFKLDIRYAGTNNFLSSVFYTSPRAFMQRPAAQALARVQERLKPLGYGLYIHDSYRPWSVTKMFWDATPEKYKLFVADPQKGSRHNRGCAVDLTLYDLKTGKPVQMVGGYDEFSDRSFPYYLGGTSLQRWRRDLLRRTMEKEGFTVYEAEWWHYDYKDWREYPILNLQFEELLRTP